MKHLLATTTILALSAGFAAAEVTLSGDARMGIVNSYDAVEGDNVTRFSSRARVKFSMSGTTDGGLEFGGSFRANNAGDAAGGTAGSVFISGGFGKLSMGDNDSAANALVGQVDGVGYTGNGDYNEIAYIGQTDTSVLYEYSAGDLTVAASIGQLDAEVDYNGDADQAYSVAASYAFGDYKVMAGYEVGQKVVNSFQDIDDAYDADPENTDWDRFDLDSHLVLGADATFGAFTAKLRVGLASGEAYDSDPVDGMQYALSGTYTVDALSVTAFTAASDIAYTWGGDDTDYGFKTNRYGIGVGYDLGGGAAVSVGYSRLKSETTGNIDYGYGQTWSDEKFEGGLTFSF